MKKILKALTGNKDIKELQSLYEQPKRDKKEEQPTFQVFKSGEYAQADLLFLPTDKLGYKYCLVVVDDHSKICDATPLKNKDAAAVSRGLDKIWARGIVAKPKVLEVDRGGEFNGLEDDEMRVRVALTNRHRSQGLVEYRNQLIGLLIHQLQAINELKNTKGKLYTGWIKELPNIITQLNLNVPKAKTVQKSDEPYFTKNNDEILPVGTKIRVQLDYPQDVHGNKVHGTFRTADIKWSRNIEKISNIILKPSFPPMYLVGDDIETSRTRNQLQVVDNHFV